MLNKVQLKDKSIATIVGGQIMTRITVKDDSSEPVAEERRVITPKAILSDGTIDVAEISTEKLKVEADANKITAVGDIVIKLSTPYDSAIITEETSGCLIPSFCAIIRCNGINREYLQAFLSTSNCKTQLKNQVAGAVMSILSVGKLGNVEIPLPTDEEQKRIGEGYIKTQEKLVALKRILELEAMKNDLIFKELMK